MSKEVDERIVSMEFDNKNFEANVRESMSTIEKLKSALKFKGAEKGLQAVEKASNKVNFSGLNSAVDQIGVRFSAMQVVATTALANITNAAVNAGKQLVNSLTVQPITSGFQEYETQIGSIQTILSNTRWQNTSLEQVNSALDQLNDYADQTIYNFTEMTRNIGTFTAAGVGLDQSVSAIKGIANLAAVSGSSSQQASTAMYQLSQALAAGRVSLMDWNSVVNAGMGGKVFQDALIRTSEIMGTGAKQAIETYGTFRESLTKGQWLTTDVLTETLKQISGAYTEAELVSQGYTQEQAAEIVALADDATNAATKVRTFTQLMDTTMEALGSGWTNTWEILIGDFDEATEFWSGISSVINDAVGRSADARNQMLQQWVDMGGRQNILDGLVAALDGLNNIVTPIKEAFSEIFPPVTAQTLLDISTGFENLMVKFRDFSAGAAPVVKDVFTAIFSVLKSIGSIIGSVASGIGEFFGVISSSGGDIGRIISQLAGFVTGAANAVTESGALTGVLTVLGNAFGNVLNAITSLLTGGVDKLGSMFSGVGDILSGAAGIIVDAVHNISSGIGDILGTADFGSIIDVFNSGMLATLITSVKGWFDSLTGGVEESTGGLIDSIKDMVGGVSENVTGVLDSVRGSLETWQTNIKTDILLKIAVAVVALVAAITVLASIDPDRLTDALGALTVLFTELIGAMTLFTKLNTNMEQLTGVATMIAMAVAIAVLAGVMKSLSDLNADQIENGMVAIAGLATVMVAVSKALSDGGNISEGAVQLILMAAAIKVLASAVIDMAALDWESIAKGLVSVGVLMGEVSIFSNNVKAEGIGKVSVAMVLMAAAMKILASAVYDFGTMDIGTIVTGLSTIGASMAIFAVLIDKLPEAKEVVKSAAAIVIMSLAFKMLLPVFQDLGNIGPLGVATSLLGIAGSLKILTEFMEPLLKLNWDKLTGLAWVLPSLTGALKQVSEAVQMLSSVSVVDIGVSLIAFSKIFDELQEMITKLDKMDIGDMAAVAIAMPIITGALYTVASAIQLLSGIGFEGSLSSIIAIGGAMRAISIGIDAVSGQASAAGALLVVSVALVAFAGAIVLISNSGIIGVVTSFIALAGAMTIVGLATKILKPLIPSMFSLAGSIATFGGSLIVLGVGTAAVGIGLGALMTSLAAGIAALVLIDPMKAGQGLIILAGAFTVIGVAAKLLKPMIGSILQLSLSLLSFSVSAAAVSVSIAVLVAALTALGSIGSEGAATIVTTLRELIIGISEMIPELIGNMMESFKAIVLGMLDALVEIAPQLADGIFQILSQTIQSSLEYMPEIAGFFIDFLIQMLNTVRERLPELFPAVTGLIGDLIKMIMDALGQWQETGNSIEMAVGIFTGMIGLVVLLNFIKGMIPGAMVGLAQLAAFVLEFGVILTLLGALQQVTGAAGYINSAGDLLQSIGTAIGQFLGGIVGGFAEGATSTLPQVGLSLSQFAMNVTPFLIAMKMVDQATIDGVTNLALAIAALAGANFADAVTTFLSGGQDFGDLGAKLIPFGQAMVQFSSIVSGIDVDAINASAACGQALAALASSLPKEGGLAQAIFGESVDMGTFATQMVAFGMALRMYATAVAGVDFGPVQESAVAGQALSDLASTLPKDGGLAQAIFGESTDMDKFGAQIVAFGLALKLYAAAVAGLDTESIQNSVTAGQALSDLANALPNEGGLAEWIFGGSDLGSFGETLAQFGDALNEFSESVAGVDTTQILAVTARVRSIKDLMSDSAALDMTGLENLKRMGELSDAYVDFYNDASSIDTGSITSHINALTQIRDFLTGLTGLDLSGANSFVQSVTDISNIALNGMTESFDVSSLESTGQSLMTSLAGGLRLGLGECTTAAKEVIQGVCDELGNPTSVDIPGAGTSVVNKFAEGIKNNIVTATGAVEQLMSSAIQGLQGHYNDFYQAGVNLAEGFASGISTSAYKAKIEAAAMANAAASAAKAALDEHSPSKVMMRIGEYAGEGFVNGLTAYSDYSYNAGTTLAESVVEGISTLKGVYDSFTDLDTVYTEFTELTEKLVETEEDQQKETEETTEKTSKLSDALNSVKDSLKGVIDRKKDINALTTIIEKAGDRLSGGFIAELFSSEGAYAGALSEMVNLTEEQLGELSDVFDDIDISEKIEDIVDTISEGIKELSDRTANINAINELITKPGLNLSDAFVAEFMNSSGEYANTAAGLIKLNADQINQIAAMYDKNQSLDHMQSAVDALAESMTDITDKKRDLNALNSVLKRTGVTLNKRFTEELMDASGQFADALAGISEMSDEMLQKLNDTFMENELFDQVQEFISILSDNNGLAEAFEKSGMSVEEFVEQIVEAGDDISDVASQIEDFAETVADGFSKLSINDQTGITEFVDNLRNNMVVAQDWGRNIETVFDKVSGYPSEMVDAFKQAVLEGGIDQYGRIMQEMAGMSSGAIMQIISLWNQAKVVGSEVGTSIVGSMYNTMNDVGENVTKGMTKGIKTGDSDVTNAAYDMCQTTVDAIKTYFKVNGDSGLSEVAYSIGKQVIEGLTTGLTQSATGLTDAMKLVDEAVTYLKSLTDQGIDLQVRVTPVLDMTDFNNKLAALKSSAVSQVSSDIMDTVNSISSSMSQNGIKNEASELTDAVKMLTDKVDSINPDNFGVTYQQNNYSPKALSTAAIYRQTKNQISMAKTKSPNSFKK